MTTTTLSSKGQVIIPKHIRTIRHWGPGQELEVIEFDDGVLLKPRSVFPAMKVDEVAGCLAYQGPTKSLADMDEAVRKGALESNRDRD
ncbi:AbrB/MazE/SpoVT family DNA-binding domain-containing protein [Desulfonatronum sp. SC1]|uniref:AbrB/MazE/SpoVT family DNA-binding domain-containing protein n=1 Tax=Desulfonatronum sp. SC1 TaxID=2109626 RepID=UPI000D30AA0A|nr:AbrB/MazE/SpoVT family DNA-binding domain-containing protein [Desulfonatronum sp. SC1]PTN34887.1 AbrB family transcriptional regulator [Desulfonatronum sp. SC1]